MPVGSLPLTVCNYAVLHLLSLKPALIRVSSVVHVEGKLMCLHVSSTMLPELWHSTVSAVRTLTLVADFVKLLGGCRSASAAAFGVQQGLLSA